MAFNVSVYLSAYLILQKRIAVISMFVNCVLEYGNNCRNVEQDEETTHSLRLSMTEDPGVNGHRNTTHKQYTVVRI